MVYPWYVTVPVIWNVAGGVFLLILWGNLYSNYSPSNNILSPVWIYDKFKLNYFGTGLLCLIFNLICPVLSVIVWFCIFIKFICTVGRK